MWDRPDILNGISTALFAAAVLMVAYALLHYAVRLPVFPLREVRVNTLPQHVTQQQIEAIVRGDTMRKPNIPESFNVLVHELRGLALEITMD